MTLRERLLVAETEQWPIWQQMRFQAMRDAGEGIVMAHMLASMQAPRMNGDTDQKFTRSQTEYMRSLSPGHLKILHKRAKMAGINPAGKYYIPGLGPDNPKAWVTSLDDAKRSYKSSNVSTEDGSIVSHKGVAKPLAPPKRLSDRIANELVMEKIQSDPKIAEMVSKGRTSHQELKESVLDQHSKPVSSSSDSKHVLGIRQRMLECKQ